MVNEFVQRDGDKDQLVELLYGTDIDLKELLSRCFIFLSKKDNAPEGQYLFHTSTVKVREKEDNSVEIKYFTNDIFKGIKESSKETFVTNALGLVQGFLIENIPFRLDKEEALREADKLNWVIGHAYEGKSGTSIEVWSALEFVDFIQ